MPVPRISVICIFLDGERYIAEAIESVLAQRFVDFELLLIDDGSTDASSAIARGYAERCPERLRYLEHEGHANRGMSASRNLGLRHARGEFVAFIDCDDSWRPQKLEEQLALMEEHPEVDLVCGAISQRRATIGCSDRIVQTGALADMWADAPVVPLRLYPLGVALSPVPSDILVRRRLIDRVGGFEDQFPGMFEDQVFLAKAYLACRVWFSSRVWIDYRIHPEGMGQRSLRDGRYVQEKRRYLSWYLDYVSRRRFPESDRLERAAKRALWLTGKPVLSRLLRWAGRLRIIAATYRPARRSSSQERRGRVVKSARPSR